METTLKNTMIQDAVNTVCQMMSLAAITAPKAAGRNFVDVKTLMGPEVQALAEGMFAYGLSSKKINFDRDGRNVANSDAVLLVGLNHPDTCGLNCGACGYDLCDEMLGQPRASGEFPGPFCAYRAVDLGIALGSAVKTASLLNVDNRIMYRIGVVARQLKLVDWEFCLGVPLSVTGKSIYFDR